MPCFAHISNYSPCHSFCYDCYSHSLWRRRTKGSLFLGSSVFYLGNQLLYSSSVFLSSDWPTVDPCRLLLADSSIRSVPKQDLPGTVHAASLLHMVLQLFPFRLPGTHLPPCVAAVHAHLAMLRFPSGPLAGPLSGCPSMRYFCRTVVLCCFSSDCKSISSLHNFESRLLKVWTLPFKVFQDSPWKCDLCTLSNTVCTRFRDALQNLLLTIN